MTTRKTTLESPVRRTKGLSERSLDTELLLHDIDSDQVTALDAEATAVWRLCDGSHSIDELATETGQSVEEVAGRLATLDDAGLLERVGMNRRTLLLRAGAVGVAVPVVSMLNLPAAAAANSVLAQTTTFSCSNGTIAGTNNHLIVTTHLTGGLANTTYNMYVYTSATLSVASLVSPTPAAGVNTNGAGAATLVEMLTTGQLSRGSTIYLKITQGAGSTTTDTVFQVVIPTSTSIYCTAP
jgi:DNA-binding Lrp family transcriptional regulator